MVTFLTHQKARNFTHVEEMVRNFTQVEEMVINFTHVEEKQEILKAKLTKDTPHRANTV